MACPSSSVCYAVGTNGKIVATTNGGSTWTGQTSGVTQTLNGIACSSTTTCIIVGNAGTVLGTTNGGSTWTAQTSGTTQALDSVACASASVCYAVGESGTILVTTNGGSTWTAQTSGTTQTLYGITCPSTGACYTVEGQGTIVAIPSGAVTSVWSAQSNLTVYYYGLDGHGSVVTLTDRNGVVQNTYRYDPYGNSLSKTENAAVNNPWQYSGGFYDTESGLYLMGARYYDPSLGRFIQTDPLGGVGHYSYAGDNPCNNADPSGMTTCYHYISGSAARDEVNSLIPEVQDLNSTNNTMGLIGAVIGGAAGGAGGGAIAGAAGAGPVGIAVGTIIGGIIGGVTGGVGAYQGAQLSNNLQSLESWLSNNEAYGTWVGYDYSIYGGCLSPDHTTNPGTTYAPTMPSGLWQTYIDQFGL